MKNWKPYFQEPYTKIISEHPDFNKFESLSDEEKRYVYFTASNNLYRSIESVKIEGSKLTYCTYIIYWRFGQGRFFKKTSFITTLCIDREKDTWWFKDTSNSTIKVINNISDFAFVNHIPSKILTKTVVKNILLGKITNPEQAVKSYLKSIKCSEFPWRLVLDYYKDNCVLSIGCVKEIFTDPISYMYNPIRCNHTIYDMVKQAYILNTKINHKWSEKRMQEVHTEWTRRIMQISINTKKQIPVWNSSTEKVFTDYGIELLNTEARTYEEGVIMHHCVYTNYWTKIQNKKYVAFSVIICGERVTVGINMRRPYMIHQAFNIYDRSLSCAQRNELDKIFNNLIPILNNMAEQANIQTLPPEELLF